MSPLLNHLDSGLRWIDSLSGFVLWPLGLLALFHALFMWSHKPSTRATERTAGWAALLLLAGLMMMLGQTMLDEPLRLERWHPLIGVLVFPWLIRVPALSGMAAFMTLLSLTALMAGIAGWFMPLPLVVGGLLGAGLLMLVLARLVRRLTRGSLPAPDEAPAPMPVDDTALQARLDSPEANEGADKYTRE